MGPALAAVAGEVARRLPLTEAVKAGADAATVRSHLSPAVAHMTVRAHDIELLAGRGRLYIVPAEFLRWSWAV